MSETRLAWAKIHERHRALVLDGLREEIAWQRVNNKTLDGQLRRAALRAAIAVLEEATGEETGA